MQNLLSSDNLIIFTTSPTGLGHIRVMDALIDGLPVNTRTVEIGLENIRANKIHALGSRIPALTKITEFYQTNPIAEKIVSKIYTAYLHTKDVFVFKKFEEINKNFPSSKTWVVISTHYALAQSIADVKEKIAKAFNKKVILCVIVTDDSPQRVWKVENANLTFAPSAETAKLLNAKAVSFPVSPRLTQPLSIEEFQKIHDQLDPTKKVSLHIDLPVSGAAVQLPYLQSFIDLLQNDEFIFSVIGQASNYTQYFFEAIRKFPNVQLSIGSSAKQTVKFYESLFYQSNRPGVEITKPSEQTFKALLKPIERGGVVLLLTDPVGRQEKDNLNFLVKNDLLPDEAHQKKLTKILMTNEELAKKEESYWHYRVSHWRAIKLPEDPYDATIFVKALKSRGILLSMLSYVPAPRAELTSNGVSQIWEEIDKYLGYNTKES